MIKTSVKQLDFDNLNISNKDLDTYFGDNYKMIVDIPIYEFKVEFIEACKKIENAKLIGNNYNVYNKLEHYFTEIYEDDEFYYLALYTWENKFDYFSCKAISKIKKGIVS